MSWSDANKVRRAFLDYFREAGGGHLEVASASLVPQNDPTLLFTNAGMNQFKDAFTGKARPPAPRATTSQKCVRAGGKHNDLENVGRTARHLTFFEMLGNFSFGDYFKPDAIAFAYELLTKRYAIDPKRLVYTVHESDDEARALWKKVAGVGDDRVISLGDKDNFWAMGETGPCGPCSELHFFQGADIPCPIEASGGKCEGPACDCDRWVEIWNLVFMQYEQVAPGDRRPLPKPSVDTGMGLERLCSVLTGVRSAYETDLLRPLIAEAEELSKVKFDAADYEGAERVAARDRRPRARDRVPDRGRRASPTRPGASTCCAGSCGAPSITAGCCGMRGGGRSCTSSRRRDRADGRDVTPSCASGASADREDVEPDEETRFRETLERGMRILEDEIAAAAGDGRSSPGELAFQLYDTYGFPLDLTRVIADGNKLSRSTRSASNARWPSSGAAARSRARARSRWKACSRPIAERVGATKFLGYDATEASSKIVALVADGKETDTVGPYSKNVAVVTAETPFYGEQGGQIGDTGTLSSGKARHGGARLQAAGVDVVGSPGRGRAGELRVGDTVQLAVDAERRDDIRRNHSATHLLHWALRSVLGTHVTQKGSLVAPDRLRFDFSHGAPLTDAEKQQVEDLVNERVRRNAAADTAVLPIAEAKQAGAIAFFGEKYGDSVRVVTMGESKEFCGGTHVARTGDIAFFLITEETGIAQGVRRIEAVTGAGRARLRAPAGGRDRRDRAAAARGRLRDRGARRQAAGRAARTATTRSTSSNASWRRAAAATWRPRRATSGACACWRRAPTSPTPRRCARSPTSCATSCARRSSCWRASRATRSRSWRW